MWYLVFKKKVGRRKGGKNSGVRRPFLNSTFKRQERMAFGSNTVVLWATMVIFGANTVVFGANMVVLEGK